MANNNKFKSKLGFIAAAASSAVGVGNIWRFPYLTGKYGGATFVLIYLLFVFLIGFPMVLAKLAFGRQMHLGAYKAYKKFGPGLWKYIGSLSALVSFLVLSFYSIVTGWLLGYFWKISKGTILDKTDFGSEFTGFISNVPLNLFFTFLTMLMIALIIRGGISDGIERISKLLMPLFVFLMIFLIGYSFTLEGSGEGLKFYLLPDFSSISPEGIYSALSQSFLSLSIGAGILVTYGGYVNKNDNLVKSSLIIVLSDTIISLLAGLIIFPLIFHKGITPNQGPALIFISLPFVFRSLGPFIGVLFGSTFFLLLVFAAITSAMSLLEVLTKYCMERFNWGRSKSVYIVSILVFLLSIPSILSFGGFESLEKFWIYKGVTRSFFDVMDTFSLDIFMPTIAVIFAIFAVYRWKMRSLFEEIKIGDKQRPLLNIFLKITLRYLSPLFITSIVIFKLCEIFFRVNIMDLWKKLF